MTYLQSGLLYVIGGTVMDGVAARPLEARTILIEDGRVKAVGLRDELPPPKGARVVDAEGKFVIPGLMNANVHLFGFHSVDGYARYMDRYEDLIAESAQVALKNGLTTVFDTWGPRRFLMSVRDRIRRGEIPGSRIFCAGNIVGFDGPFSADFFGKVPDVASAAFVKRINAIWVENVGRHLMWLTPEQVAEEVRAYIAKGIDFVKYGSNEHFPGAFLAFSPYSQRAIVDEAHAAGMTAQAHSLSVEGLRLAIEAGCDLVTHCNITGGTAIPERTLDQMIERGTGAVVFPFTRTRLETIIKNVSEMERGLFQTADANVHSLIRKGASLMLANDGAIITPEWAQDPQFGNTWITTPGEDNLCELSSGHFAWLKAMEEKGCRAMDMLHAATRNIARAYGKDQDLGTIEAGKLADLVILDRNPLEAADNYRCIHAVIKEGALVERNSLPMNPVVGGAREPASPEEAAYVPFIASQKLPLCPCSIR